MLLGANFSGLKYPPSSTHVLMKTGYLPATLSTLNNKEDMRTGLSNSVFTVAGPACKSAPVVGQFTVTRALLAVLPASDESDWVTIERDAC